MKIKPEQIQAHNSRESGSHRETFEPLANQLTSKKVDVDSIIQNLSDYQVAIPSWALGAGGTRFGRFAIGGEPASLKDKIDDVGLLHALNGSSGAISLHIPWDIPDDADAIKKQAAGLGLVFDAVNSNTFQDQNDQKYSYKFGSLCHTDASVRKQAVEHNIEVIRHGEALGSKAITVWLADGSSFPGQQNFRKALQRTLSSLEEIYRHLPADWKMLIEYKPYEPNFYSTVIPDWGTSFLLASKLGDQAETLVDLGHHLPNTNIEQIVATLMMEGKLGGFHFNDSKYGDDDLTTGSIKPYQLFLIFNELVEDIDKPDDAFSGIAWMIDASHNVKDPLEDLLQSVEAIRIAFARALLVNRQDLEEARNANDVARAQDVLQDAFRTDVRPLLREARVRSGAAANPIGLYRELNVRKTLIRDRGRGRESSKTGCTFVRKLFIPLVTGAVLASGAAACGDPTGGLFEPLMVTDTVSVGIQGVAPAGTATAVSVVVALGRVEGARSPELASHAEQWDFALATREGQTVFLPPRAFGFQDRAGIIGPLAGRTLTDVQDVPSPANFQMEEPVQVEQGQVYVARSREFSGGFGGCVQYSKFEPISVDLETGIVRLVISTNSRCFDTRLPNPAS
jgi:L-rhamnose isomerase / sugar isomerase